MKFFILLLFFFLAWQVPAQIPPLPNKINQLTFDYANLLNPTAKEEIAGIQNDLFTNFKSTLVVVTVASMGQYGSFPSIETFAKEWFNTWKIGTQNNNNGILFIISVGDRKARIELGADWGHAWDFHCEDIMQDDIIPHFKNGDYSTGILSGVQKLARMAEKGPHQTPPEKNIYQQVKSSSEYKFLRDGNKSISNKVFDLLLFGGIALIILSFFMPQYRKQLLWAGILMVGFALFIYALICIGIFIRTRMGRSSHGGSFGGGFGGGSSGGGGASGSW
jgi:uncharacterized protein